MSPSPTAGLRPDPPPEAARDLLLDLTPRLLLAARSELDARWGARPARYLYNRFYLIESGEGEVSVGGESLRLRPGHLYFLPAHTLVGYRTERRVVILWAHCTLGPASGLEWGNFLPCRHEVPLEHPAHFRQLFLRLIALHTQGPGGGWGAELEIRGLLCHLLAACALPAGEHPRHPLNRAQFQRFQPVLERMERTQEPPPALADLARLAHMTPTAFSRRFAALFGVPPIRYQLGRRIAAARTLLLTSDLKLDAIARRLGFSDSFHFSKTFKQFTGLAPQPFRQNPPAPLP